MGKHMEPVVQVQPAIESSQGVPMDPQAIHVANGGGHSNSISVELEYPDPPISCISDDESDDDDEIPSEEVDPGPSDGLIVGNDGELVFDVAKLFNDSGT